MVPDRSEGCVTVIYPSFWQSRGGIRERTALRAYRIKVVNVTLRDVDQESKDNCLVYGEGEKKKTHLGGSLWALTDTACTAVIVCKHRRLTNTHTHTRVTQGFSPRRGHPWRKLKENSVDFTGPSQLLNLISTGSQMFWKMVEGRIWV